MFFVIITNNFSIINKKGYINVKITMLDWLIGLVAPHYCCSCGRVGRVLCEDCKYDIISERKDSCLFCGGVSSQSGLCQECALPYDRAWLVGERLGALFNLINLYKFKNLKSAHKDLADLVLLTLPQLPDSVVLVPVPTVPSHIRQRGYDHVLLVAKRIAKARGVPLRQIICRQTKTKQRQASATQRRSQASQAFAVSGKLDPDKTYLLIDDVMTTGSTIEYAARSLKKAGAKQVWVVVIARQPINKT